MRCGWMPADQWDVDEDDLVIEIAVSQAGMMKPGVCPGYAIQLPAVYEAARAWGHWEKGQLQLRYAAPPQLLMDLIELFNQEKAAAESWSIEEHQKASRSK